MAPDGYLEYGNCPLVKARASPHCRQIPFTWWWPRVSWSHRMPSRTGIVPETIALFAPVRLDDHTSDLSSEK